MLGMIIDIMKFLLLVYIALELRDISCLLYTSYTYNTSACLYNRPAALMTAKKRISDVYKRQDTDKDSVSRSFRR